MRGNLFFRLRFRLAALVLLAVLPALVLLVFFSLEQRRHTLEEAQEKVRTLALVTSQQFNNVITEQEMILLTLSKLTRVKERNIASCNLIFADLLQKRSGVLGYRLADAQGRLLGGVPPPAMPTSYADRAWFRRLQETRRFQTSGFVIGKTIPQPIMPLAYPVLDSRGEISSILVASFSVGWLEEFLQKCQLPQGTHALLVDRQGVILANYPHAGEKVGESLPQSPLIRAMLDRQEGFVEAECLGKGIPVIYAFTAVGEGEEPLKLAVGFEKALVLQHVSRGFLIHLSLLGLAAGLALAGSLAFGNLLVRRPVLRILEATGRMAAGDLEARTGLPGRKGELNRLGQAFDEMAAALQEREAALQQQFHDLAAMYAASEAFLGQVGVAETLQEACRLAVEQFGLSMAWIGLTAAGDYLVHPAAVWGEEAGYLDSIKVTWDEDSPTSQGPAGIAIRTRQAMVIHDTETDPAFVPWREAALARGYRSVVGLPMFYEEEMVGTLLLYSGEPDYFTPDRIQVCQSLANQTAVAFQKARFYEEIQRHVMELENRVAERTAEADAARGQADAASRAKSDFLANMSHELRTPLNSVIGFSEVLRDQYFGPLNDKQAEYIKDIWESGQYLLMLINDVLDLAKVEAGKMELELSRVKIADLLEHSLVMVKEKTLRLGIRLECRIPAELADLEVDADERKLKQVTYNLLSNAAKFTPDGGAITLELQKADDVLRISVADTGRGIAAQDLEKIFEEFHQVMDKEQGKTPGTGLGLSLSRRMVEMWGGKLWAECEGIDRGSRFVFTLPLITDKATMAEPR